jgi:hypothetical protein
VVEDNCEEPKIEIIDDGRDNEPEVETKWSGKTWRDNK